MANVIFLASATCTADPWAHWIRIFTSAIATFALTVFFIFIHAHWWNCDHGFGLWLLLSWALFQWHATTVTVSDMIFPASATRDADSWADRIRFFTSAITAIALTVFFILTSADWGHHGHGFRSRNAASFRLDTNAVFIFQVAGFTETPNNTLPGTDIRTFRVGACWSAS
jgi:hypothetical protein